MAAAKPCISPYVLPVFVSALFLTFLSLPSAADNVLYTRGSLLPGQSLVQGNYSLIMQGDCNLVLYYESQPLWASQTYGRGSGCIALLQRDGDLVIYTENGRPVWASGTRRYYPGNYVLVLQPNGDVVIYGSAIWATGTRFYGSDKVVEATPTKKAALPTTLPVTVANAERARRAGHGGN